MKLTNVSEFAKTRQAAEATFREANGEETLKEFDQRIVKGNRFLASLRDRAKSETIPGEYMAAAETKLAEILVARREFQRKYELPMKLYSVLDKIAGYTTTLGFDKNPESANARPTCALQIKIGEIELLLDLAYDGIPF